MYVHKILRISITHCMLKYPLTFPIPVSFPSSPRSTYYAISRLGYRLRPSISTISERNIFNNKKTITCVQLYAINNDTTDFDI